MEALESLQTDGLKLNKIKTKILDDTGEVDPEQGFMGVEVVKALKYLEICSDRKQLIAHAKEKCRKQMAIIRGKVQSTTPEVAKLLQAWYYRSLLLYYLTPLLAAGVINKKEINMFEAELIRK